MASSIYGPPLPTHIHRELAHYAYTHITTDYVVYTELLANELLSEALQPIPLYPSSISAIQSDPTDALLQPTTERAPIAFLAGDTLAVDEISRTLLRETIRSMSKARPEGNSSFEDIVVPRVGAMSPPLLSRQARTKHCGSQDNRPWSLHESSDILTSANASILDVEEEALSPLADLLPSDVLKITNTITPSIASYIKDVLAIISAPKPPDQRYMLQEDPPLVLQPDPDAPMSPPLWPRRPFREAAQDITNLPINVKAFEKTMADIPLLDLEEPTSDELRQENLAIVGGWHAFAPQSSPSSLSSVSSRGSDMFEIDELLHDSPTPPTSAYDADMRIEPPRFPRLETLEGAAGRTVEKLGDGHSLNSFLFSLAGIGPSSNSPNKKQAGRKAEEQWSTLAVEDGLDELDGELDFVNEAIPPLSVKPHCLIMNEPLDDDDEHRPLPVPSLPDFIAEDAQSFAPMEYRALLYGEHPQISHAWQCLKRVQVKAVQIQLPWSPYPGTEQITSDEELCGVQLDISEYMDKIISCSTRTEPGSDLEVTLRHYLELVHELEESNDSPTDYETHLFTREENIPSISHLIDNVGHGLQDMIMNRNDRRRILNLPPLNIVALYPPSHEPLEPSPPRKRLRFSSQPRVIECSDDYELDYQVDYGLDDDLSMDAEHGLLPMNGYVSPASSLDDLLLDDVPRTAVDPDWTPSNSTADTTGTAKHEVSTYAPSDWQQGPDVDSPAPPSNLASQRMLSVLQPAPTSTRAPVAPAAPTASSVSLGIKHFLRLRSLDATTSNPLIRSSSPLAHVLEPTGESLTTRAPEDVMATLIDAHTLVLPSSPLSPATEHYYLASLNTIQKSELVRILSLPGPDSAAVTLIEREHLSGVDLILDSDTAIILVSGPSLPIEHANVIRGLEDVLLEYTHILLLFECYPPSAGWRPRSGHAGTGAKMLTPPFVKAMQNLRRTVTIVLDCDDRLRDTEISYAFGLSPHDTAAFIRMFGDEAERRDTSGGLIWGDRAWLVSEESEQETWLAGPNYMNPFAAAVILAGVDLDVLLEGMTPQQRRQELGPLVGDRRVGLLNTQIASRDAELQDSLPPSSPPPMPASSSGPSLLDVPFLEDDEILPSD